MLHYQNDLGLRDLIALALKTKNQSNILSLLLYISKFITGAKKNKSTL